MDHRKGKKHGKKIDEALRDVIISSINKRLRKAKREKTSERDAKTSMVTFLAESYDLDPLKIRNVYRNRRKFASYKAHNEADEDDE